MQRYVRWYALLLLLCTTGCVRFTAGIDPSSYKPQFRGWINGYANYNEMRNYDGVLLKITTFNDTERPGEIVSADLWPLAGIGIGPVGCRIRLLPFGLGFGTLAYDPRPTPAQTAKAPKQKKIKRAAK